ncbi:purine nucleoside phosphorylase [Burkholderia contaminans]|uniref:DUF4148 domain-containing protein n=1 Tax=Burkholderia contaminans TaxID=488447 RepID=UPI001454941F|nr:DUF4148 domain-containing protein [Burkholderia contaminans]VWD05427.1 purine nucleoside phosphorylase [Burkholderia contaminans]
MGSAMKFTALAAIMLVPALALSQTSRAPLTRVQVRNQLIQFEDAGYYPSRKDNMYPAPIQAAAATVSCEFSGNPARQAATGPALLFHSPSYALSGNDSSLASRRSNEMEPACAFCW